MTSGNWREEMADEVVDGLDADRTAKLLATLDAGPPGHEALRSRARQKLMLWRLANGLDQRPPSPATVAMTDQLAANLASRRRFGPAAWAASILLVVGAAVAAYNLAPRRANERIYGFETATSRVLLREPEAEEVEVSPQRTQATLARLSNWIGRPLAIPDLTRSGFHLTGVKLLEARGARIVGLIYRGEDGELTLCLSRDLDGLKEAPEFVETVDLQAGYWSDGERTYALLRNGGRKGARQLVAEIRDATSPS